MRQIFGALLAVAAISGPGSASACGIDSDCVVGDRTYRIALPDSWDGSAELGAIVFAHGHAGSAAGVMRNRGLLRMANDLGVALIAPQGQGGDWILPHSPEDMTSTGVAEYTYFDALMADAAARYHIDPARTLMTGFSAGGMMVWELACHRSTLMAAYVPLSGTFWAPVPDTCDGAAASIVHIHGTMDDTVPLAGRPIGPARQGAVADAMAMYRAFGGFAEQASDETIGDMECQMRTNAGGQVLDLCLFPGKHSFRLGTVEWAWQRLSDLGILAPG